jgi:hypothetical protein
MRRLCLFTILVFTSVAGLSSPAFADQTCGSGKRCVSWVTYCYGVNNTGCERMCARCDVEKGGEALQKGLWGGIIGGSGYPTRTGPSHSRKAHPSTTNVQHRY